MGVLVCNLFREGINWGIGNCACPTDKVRKLWDCQPWIVNLTWDCKPSFCLVADHFLFPAQGVFFLVVRGNVILYGGVVLVSCHKRLKKIHQVFKFKNRIKKRKGLQGLIKIVSHAGNFCS